MTPASSPRALLRLRTALAVALAFLAGTAVGPVAGSAAGTTTTSTSWAVQELSLADGRTYFANVPLSGQQEVRQVVVFLHAAGAGEDAVVAEKMLTALRKRRPNTIFVFGVSAGDRLWDAGICCTDTPRDDVGYLVDVVEHLDTGHGVNRQRVGLLGFSNGGMLAEKAHCQRPDVFTAAASWAGTYAGPCDVGPVRVGQWHGTADRYAPYSGGTRTIGDQTVTFPPASRLGTRMAAGSTFQLTAVPGHGHHARWDQTYIQLRWLHHAMPR